jgi:hypothetical protein
MNYVDTHHRAVRPDGTTHQHDPHVDGPPARGSSVPTAATADGEEPNAPRGNTPMTRTSPSEHDGRLATRRDRCPMTERGDRR